ncbi:hypothetical protein B0J12DRAFT_390077 [Macrophomina phaseolina]|uniref:Uncharacterized protein n=1 Tax=Macrophomina phaseolina TaxID=35725 RepID=A0ABQ8FSR6_9PEZI|nr:hypothetical protein B0J12DRAFT_390077 [Macrophomina phaseolina]
MISGSPARSLAALKPFVSRSSPPLHSLRSHPPFSRLMVLYHRHRRVQRSAPSPPPRFQGLFHALVPVSSAATGRLRRWVRVICVSLPQKHVGRFSRQKPQSLLFCLGSYHHQTSSLNASPSCVSISGQSWLAQNSRRLRRSSPCWTNASLAVKLSKRLSARKARISIVKRSLRIPGKFNRSPSKAMGDVLALAGAKN